MPPTAEIVELNKKFIGVLVDQLKRDKRLLAVLEDRIEEKNTQNAAMQKTKKKMKGIDPKAMYNDVIRLEDIAKKMKNNIDKKMEEMKEFKISKVKSDVVEDNVVTAKTENNDGDVTIAKPEDEEMTYEEEEIPEE